MAKSSDIIITRTSRANSASASESSRAEEYPMRVAFSVGSADYYINLANHLQTNSTARTVVPHAQLNNNSLIVNIPTVVTSEERTQPVEEDVEDSPNKPDSDFLLFEMDDLDIAGGSNSD